jgi:hypothetical protein
MNLGVLRAYIRDWRTQSLIKLDFEKYSAVLPTCEWLSLPPSGSFYSYATSANALRSYSLSCRPKSYHALFVFLSKKVLIPILFIYCLINCQTKNKTQGKTSFYQKGITSSRQAQRLYELHLLRISRTATTSLYLLLSDAPLVRLLCFEENQRQKYDFYIMG